jgi:prepilin-type N-terminal cleavage/methylation domain-containing protein
MRFRRHAAAAGRRLAAEAGYSLSELLVVLAIITIVVSSLVALFVSASNASVDMTRRFEAQQEMRFALDKLRREIHCASEVTLYDGDVSTGFARAEVNLGSYCPTNSAGATITWCTRASTVGYDLVRYTDSAVVTNCTSPPIGVAQRIEARYLVTHKIFKGISAGGGGSLPTLSVYLPVDITPADPKQLYKLEDNIALRNAAR